MSDDIETDATKEDVVVPEDQQGLINDLLSDEPVKDEVQEEEVVEEEKPEEEPEKVEEEEEKPEVEEEKPEEEIKEEPSEKEEEDEVTEDDPLQALMDRNDKLSDQIIAMAEQGFGIKSPDEEETITEETEEIKEKPEPIKLEELKIEDFLTEDELDRVNDHPELMNEAFNRAMKIVMEHINTALNVIGPLEQEVKALPKQVSEAVGEQMNFNTFVNSFYDDNPELKGKPSKVVHIVYNKLLTDAQKEGKKSTIGELYNQAGDEVREMLSITKAPAKADGRKPALPGAKTPARKQKVPETPGEAKTQLELMAYVTSD